MRSNLLVILHFFYFFVASFLGLFLTLFLTFGLFSIFTNANYYFYKDIFLILKDSVNLSFMGAILLSISPLFKTILYFCKKE
ncbi:hypothetical protein A4G16_00445 [Mannheimia granulomatis]|uniref:Uncharacterized protein n=1 Tax=Mannheimia granulomatis TaxID=85402 RepID=A0A6G8JG08_9PAST|nr:hypothetical protein A4G16_00445 [Mannheimia granulomatis]